MSLLELDARGIRIALAALAEAMGYELDDVQVNDVLARIPGDRFYPVQAARRAIRDYAKVHGLVCTLGMP